MKLSESYYSVLMKALDSQEMELLNPAGSEEEEAERVTQEQIDGARQALQVIGTY